jgi:eukaryotic-like serine/threonine-protein kinase
MTAADPQIDDFVGALKKSGLMEPFAVDEYLSRHGPAQSARQLAAHLIRDAILTNFQARMLLEGKHRGFVANGKYKILELLAVGGMGSVYLCEHMLMRRLVAMKVLSRDQQLPAGAAERFLREARAAAALDHPNLVRAFDVDRLGGGQSHCLIMEFVEGVNLQTLVEKSGALPPGRAVEYIVQGASGLAHAHLAGLIHRDIKPANMLLTRQGIVKVLDLGLARFSGDNADNLTRELANDAILGTADYIAPEQAANGTTVDGRADIYSLGCSLYFLLSGHPPYPTGSAAHKLIWHQTVDATPLHVVKPGIPVGLSSVVQRMLAKKPQNRFPDMRAVVDALTTFLGGPIPPPDEKDMPTLCPAVRKLVGETMTTAPVNYRTPSTHEFLIPPTVVDPSGMRSGVRSGGSGIKASTIDLTEVPTWRGRKLADPTVTTANVASSMTPSPGAIPGAEGGDPRKGPWKMVGVAITAAVLGIAGFAALQANKPSEMTAKHAK